MKRNFIALIGFGCLLAGCHASMADGAESLASQVVRGKAPGDPGAGLTLCTPDEEVLISCRLGNSPQIVSICIARSRNGEPRTARFAQGMFGETPALQYPADDSDTTPVFRRTHLVRAGGSGGFAYTFEQGDYRYGFYSEEGTYHAMAGFFQALPALPHVVSHRLCDMQTLVLSYELSDVSHAWPEDPLIDEYDVPLADASVAAADPEEAIGKAAEVHAAPAPTMRLQTQTSRCSADEVAVLSCKLASSDRVASLCALPSSDGRPWSFRFAYGADGAPLVARFPGNGVDHGEGFTKSRLMLFGGAGGLVYSTVADDRRYSLYSIQGKGFSIAGLQISLPGAEKAVSDKRCLQETVVESEDDNLYEALRHWKPDPSYENRDLLPVIDSE